MILFLYYICVYVEISFGFGTGVNESRMSALNTSAMADALADFSCLCPFNTFCKSPALKQENFDKERTSCCQECSCDADCYEIGNCCPDAPFATAGKLKYPCVNFSGLMNISLETPDDSLWFHVIDKCQDQFSLLAHFGCYHAMDLEDLVPVSDPTNGRVYKNKHCATCNGVYNYVNWNLKISCSDIFLYSFQTTEQRNMYIFQNREKCRVNPVPPDEKAGYMSRCYPVSEIRSTCNISGLWDVYDKDIEEACHLNRQNQNVIFSVQEQGTRVLDMKFANVYCFLCNTPKNTKRNDLCKLEKHTISKTTFKGRFSAIIDVRSEEDLPVEKYPCKRIEIMDPFTKLCRPLTCPSATIPGQGSCKSMISGFEGYSIAMNFEVSFGGQNMSVTYETILKILEKRIAPMLGSGCGTAFTYLIGGRNSSVFIFVLGMYTKDKCPPDIILRNAQKLSLRSEIYFTFEAGSKMFEVVLRLVFRNYLSDGEYLLYRSYYGAGIHRMIDSSIIHYCPRINITRQEVYLLGLNGSLGTIAESSENNESMDIYSVCVDTYFKTRQALSGTVPFHRRSNHIELFCLHTLTAVVATIHSQPYLI